MPRHAIDILLVEDNPADLELMLFALRESGSTARLHVARDGEEALDFLLCRGPHRERSFEQPPKVVLLDLKLPKVDGLEVLLEIKGDPRTRAIPVVALTSSAEQRDMAKCYSLGINSYVQKPVDFKEFQRLIQTLSSYWLAVNQTLPVKPV